MSIEQQDKSRAIRPKIWRAVRSALGIMAGLAATLTVFLILGGVIHDADKEKVSLIAQYDGTKGAAVVMMPNGYQEYYNISKDGVMHDCTAMPLQDLRQFKPIHCDDGTVITKK